METIMNKTLIAAAALALLGAPMALAASTATPTPAKPAEMHHLAASTPSAQCTTLEQQFSRVEQSHKSLKTFGEAAKLRDEGRTLCLANKAPAGINKLDQALKLIGVTPEVKG
jgi:hypothetical protein